MQLGFAFLAQSADFLESDGKLVQDAWDEIDHLAPTDDELLRYVAEVRAPLDYYDE